MPSKNTQDNFTQLSLPFNEPASKKEVIKQSNIICFNSQIEIKKNKANLKKRQEKIKKIIKYADSLGW